MNQVLSDERMEQIVEEWKADLLAGKRSSLVRAIEREVLALSVGRLIRSCIRGNAS